MTAERVRQIIASGADVNEQRGYGDASVLMWTARCTQAPEVLNELLNAGADVNGSGGGQSALLWAVRYNDNPELIDILLAAGANVNMTDNDGKSMLMWAAEVSANPEVFRLLLEAGADVNLRGAHDETALLYSILYGSDPAVLSLLLDAGADVNLHYENNVTALMLSIRYGLDPMVLGLLLDAGADVDERNENDETLLMNSIQNGASLQTIHLLLEAGADPNAQDENGDTPLILANRKHSRPEVIRLLRDAGADAGFAGGQRKLFQDLLEQQQPVDLYLREPNHINTPEVKILQKFLMANGYDLGSDGADGWFGSMTDSALRAHQADNGLEVSGRIASNLIPLLPRWRYTIRGGDETPPNSAESTAVKFTDEIPSSISGRYGDLTLRRTDHNSPVMGTEVVASNGVVLVYVKPGLISQSPSGRRFVLLKADYYGGGGDEALIIIDVLLEQVAWVNLSHLLSRLEVGNRSYIEIEDLIWNNDNLWFRLSINFLGPSGHPGIDSQYQEALGGDFGRDDPITSGWLCVVPEEST